MIKIKKITPMFTKIVTTCEKYETDQKTGKLIDTRKQAGAVKEYQKVVAVGSNSAGIKVGDIVMINPMRYAVMKHEKGSIKDGVIQDNPILGFNMPIIDLDGVPHMLLETQDIEFIINEYDEVQETKSGDTPLYVPQTTIIRS